MTLTIEVKENIQRSLEEMAAEKGMPVGQFVADIIGVFVDNSSSEDRELRQFRRLSETSFNEWNNEEDAIYDRL